MKQTLETHPALAETARELRAARKRAEDENLAQSQARRQVWRRGPHARAAVSSGVTKAQETWIGTRWYARSHPRLVTTVAVAAAVFLASAVSLAFLRED